MRTITAAWQRRRPSWVLAPELLGGHSLPGRGRSNTRLASLLRQAERILVFTGGGICRDTGTSPPEDNITAPESPMASEEACLAYWERKDRQWDRFRSARPSAVHWAIVELERMRKLEQVVTHNVDGLHLWAGTSPSRLVEIHGTNAELVCPDCGRRHDPAIHYARFRRERTLPTCDCGGQLRAATIDSHEQLRDDDVRRAGCAAAAADLVIALGSSLDRYPASSIPLLAAQNGVPYVVISRGATGHDDHPLVTVRLDADPLIVFPHAVATACRSGRLR